MKKILCCLLFAMCFGLSACETKKETIKVGASSTPHAEILEMARAFIEAKGYKLEIVVFNDYVLPNIALDNGELDANYFQHQPYLEEFNKKNNTKLVSAGAIHFEPLGIYAGRKTTLEELKQGDTILVPNDKSNYDRAIELLKNNGIQLNVVKIVEVEAQNIPALLKDCDYAVVNGNYALSSKITDKVIVTELNTSDIAIQMANIVAVKEGNENNEKIKILMEALKQKVIKNFIKDKYGSSVIPMF